MGGGRGARRKHTVHRMAFDNGRDSDINIGTHSELHGKGMCTVRDTRAATESNDTNRIQRRVWSIGNASSSPKTVECNSVHRTVCVGPMYPTVFKSAQLTSILFVLSHFRTVAWCEAAYRKSIDDEHCDIKVRTSVHLVSYSEYTSEAGVAHLCCCIFITSKSLLIPSCQAFPALTPFPKSYSIL